jgi:hypothetical protein
MAAGGTEPEVEPAAAFLAALGLRLREYAWYVVA